MKNLKPPSNKKVENGFTIIELLIATVIFSAIMLLLSIGVIQIANVYYKGITESNTQNVARDIINNIAQAIQFNSTGTVQPPSTNGFGTTSVCIGSTQYAYVLHYQLVKTAPSSAAHQTNHGMLENNGSCASGSTLDLLSAGSLPVGDANDAELLGQNMRLANLTITPVVGSANFYTIDVRVVYGADDLLANPTSTTTNCQGGAGSQFCAVAELSTTVQQRL